MQSFFRKNEIFLPFESFFENFLFFWFCVIFKPI